MPEPTAVAVAAALAAAVNTAVAFVRLAYDIKNTPTDVKTCLDLVCRVDEDIQFAINLRAQQAKQLSMNPENLRRLDRIIAQASESIIDVGRLLEGCRREANGGKVPFQGRLKWILGDSTAFSKRTANLQQQHAAINAEIAYMRQIEALKPLRELTASTVFENAELLSMSRKRSSSKLSVFSGSETQPPEYSLLASRPSMIFESTHFSQALNELVLNPEKQSASASIVAPRRSMVLTEESWSQPVHKPELKSGTEQLQTWSELEAEPRQSIQGEWELESSHVAQNWNPSGGIPRSLVPGLPGSWKTADADTRRDWNPSGTCPPLLFSPSWETINSHPAQNNQPSVISPRSTSPREWPANYPSSPHTNVPSIMSSGSITDRGWELPTITNGQTWDITPSGRAESIVSDCTSNSNSSTMPLSISSPQWGTNCSRPNQTYSQPSIPPKKIGDTVPIIMPPSEHSATMAPQCPDRPPILEADVISPPQLWTAVSIPAPFAYAELESKTSNTSRTCTTSAVPSSCVISVSSNVPDFNTPLNLITSPLWVTSGGWGPGHSTYGEIQVPETMEDEDPEVAFYRDLRQQEVERRRRAAWKNTT